MIALYIEYPESCLCPEEATFENTNEEETDDLV